MHLWLISDSEGDEDNDNDPKETRYDWFDLTSGGNWNFDDGKSQHLWAYTTHAMEGGSLSLSGSWERDPSKKRWFFQLTLWVDHEVVRRLEDEKQIPPTDIIFKIPLDPGRLCDEQGEMVVVPGKDGTYKAGEVEPFPYDAHGVVR